jgi:uncharacterized BrkB/YihY/UPF0761 family membrane protein
MVKYCSSSYLFLALAIFVALSIGLGLWEQIRLRHRHPGHFGRQGTRLLLTMLGLALISIAVFAVYIVVPQKGCY